MKYLTILLTSILSFGSGSADPLAIGASAPQIEGVDQDGNAVQFSSLYKKEYTLVFFYPKANTPGCTRQACSLRDSYAELLELGVAVVGVSLDKQEAQKKFHQEQKLPYPLLADPEGKIVAAFGVPRKGKFSARQAFLIHNGKVVWRDLAASTDQQAADVIAFIKQHTDSAR